MTKWQLFLQIFSHFRFIVVMEVCLKDKLMNFRFVERMECVISWISCKSFQRSAGSDWEPLLQGFDHKDRSTSWHLHHSSFSGQW
ncbi:hypothetical protein Hanom_Chr07g00597271 [Helianthus anomalus]